MQVKAPPKRWSIRGCVQYWTQPKYNCILYALMLSAQNQNGIGGSPPPMSSGGIDCACR